MAIKNFQAARKPEGNENKKAALVSDYMTKSLITFQPNQSVLEVMEILIKKRISGGPVVNEKNELKGIISEGDFMKQISESKYFNMPMVEMHVDSYMIKDVETISGDMGIFEAASLFHQTKRKRFPVLENGKLVGQISRRDVLKAAFELKAHNW